MSLSPIPLTISFMVSLRYLPPHQLDPWVDHVLGLLTLFLGSLGYAVYISALWCYQIQKAAWLTILAGAILGISAGLLWVVQGAIMMSCPLEKDNGKAFGIFWAIFQFGAFIGSVTTLLRRAAPAPSQLAHTLPSWLLASSVLALPLQTIVRGDAKCSQS
ncbi:uncharacterized protein EI90DRAFT_269510 [Cantharellus anzutake]|uniref:uncharacterized protein n=1 Tax=Cantharellus anzutake TaxID=1750568 RepID=UPI001904F8A0|nr:uncharacterized protein EI90DRAFT_269510 [Cantharellus anzutake]KAF8335874.1 hypothetical protein EI90DRAFT_269510 [Cantharellus anzutake]